MSQNLSNSTEIKNIVIKWDHFKRFRDNILSLTNAIDHDLEELGRTTGRDSKNFSDMIRQQCELLEDLIEQ